MARVLTVYLVKSSETLEDGTIHWENLRAFTNEDSAEKFMAKVQALIDEDGDEETASVEIETLSLED